MENASGWVSRAFVSHSAGNFFKDLREESADFVSNLDMPGIAIGGLSVGNRLRYIKKCFLLRHLFCHMKK